MRWKSVFIIFSALIFSSTCSYFLFIYDSLDSPLLFLASQTIQGDSLALSPSFYIHLPPVDNLFGFSLVLKLSGAWPSGGGCLVSVQDDDSFSLCGDGHVGRFWDRIIVDGTEIKSIKELDSRTGWVLLHFEGSVPTSAVGLKVGSVNVGFLSSVLLWNIPISQISTTTHFTYCTLIRHQGLAYELTFGRMGAYESTFQFGRTRFDGPIVSSTENPPQCSDERWFLDQPLPRTPEESICEPMYIHLMDINLSPFVEEKGIVKTKDDAELICNHVGHCDGYTKSCSTCGWRLSQAAHMRYWKGSQTYLRVCPKGIATIFSSDLSNQAWTSPLFNKRHKLVWCAIPKSGCTTVKLLFHRLQAHADWKDDKYLGSRRFHNPEKNGLSYLWQLNRMTDASALLSDSSIRKIALIRDPLERLLSAYMDKCVKQFEKNICPQKNLSFEEFALIVANTPSEDLNIHFKPQALHCDLYKFKNLYRFVNLEDFTYRQLLKELNMEKYYKGWGPESDKTLDQMGRHATHAKTVVHKYYSKYLALKMMEKYQVDYQTFQLAKPIWIKKLH